VLDIPKINIIMIGMISFGFGELLVLFFIAAIIIAIVSPVSIFIGKIMKSNVSAKKNTVVGCIAFFVTGIIAFFGNLIYYKFFITERERYLLAHSSNSSAFAGKILIATLLLAIIGWGITIYIINKKKN